nr:MAG TPA: low molecular weight protein-tyrosine-phosphatase [Caudoviricetes sp.]
MRTSKVRFFVFGDQPRCAVLVVCLGNVSRSLYSLVQGLEVCLVKADN